MTIIFKQKEKFRVFGEFWSHFMKVIFLSYFYFYTFFNVFYRFDLITSHVRSMLASIVGSLVSIAVSIFIMHISKVEEKTRIQSWVMSNYSKILMGCLISSLFFASVQSEVTVTLDSLMSLIEIEWTIFGITVAVFLVWNALLLDYIKKRMPKPPEKGSPVKVLRYIDQKEIFYGEASSKFHDITLLIINMMLLSGSTGVLYLSYNEIPVLSQNIVVLSLYFCTNTLVILFLDTLKPILDEKKEVLRESKVTKDDIKLYNEIDRQIPIVLEEIRIIGERIDYSQEQKEEEISTMLKEFSEQYGTYSEQKGQEEVIP